MKNDSVSAGTPSAPSAEGPGSGELIRFISVLVLFWSSLYIFLPVMAPIADVRGASLALIGIIVSSYGFVQLVLRIPLGIWSDRIGRRRPFITYGFLAAIAGALGMGLIDNPVMMVLFRGFTGITASMWIMLTVVFSGRFPADQTARAMGIAVMVTNLSQLFATLVGGLLADRFGWHAPFLAAAMLGAAGFVVSRGLSDVRVSKGPAPGLRELIGIGRQRLLLTVSLLAALLQAIPHMTIWGFTTVFAVELGARGSELGMLGFGAGIMMAIGAYSGGRFLVPRLGARVVVTIGFSLAGSAALAIPAVRNVYQLLALQMVLSLGTGVTLPTLMSLSIATVPPDRRATAMGFFQAIYSLGMFSGPLIAGGLAGGFGVPAVFIGVAAISGVGAVCAAVFVKR